jgi:hypothetical protein
MSEDFIESPDKPTKKTVTASRPKPKVSDTTPTPSDVVPKYHPESKN